MLLFYLAVYIIILIIAEQMVIDRFNIKKRNKWFYSPVNRVHLWGEIAIIIPMVAIFYFNRSIRLYFVPVFLTMLFGFRAFMEWKYDKASKTYILSLFTLIVVLMTFFMLKLSLFK